MFDLVNDVEAYPTRFPWCAGAEIIEREKRARTIGARRAAGSALRGPDAELHDAQHRRTRRTACTCISSRARCAASKATSHSRALGEDGCKIALALDFEYAGFLAGPALRLGFQGLANRMVDDFCRAAAKIYG